jgi:ABC-2 type transport system permease protein
MKIFFTLIAATVQALIRERILYNVFFVAIFLLGVGYLAALLVFGHQDRVMLHFGMMVNALSVFFISASAGSRLVSQEIESRTIYLTLAKPIARPIYFFAKWLGINLFAGLNLILLSLVLIGGLALTGGKLNEVFLQAITLIWIETFLISAIALFAGQGMRPALAMMVVFSYLFISHNHEQIQYLNQQGAARALGAVQFLFPKADVFLLDTRVYYDLGLTLGEWVKRVGYGLGWSLFFMVISNATFYRRNL